MNQDTQGAELLPCPKCGERKTYMDQMAGEHQAEVYGFRWERICDVCEWAFGTAETQEQADALWNTRAATQGEPAGEESVAIPKRLYDFLMGTGEINDLGFGDMNEGLPGAFWWRALLMTAATPLYRHPPAPADREAIRREAFAEAAATLAPDCGHEKCGPCVQRRQHVAAILALSRPSCGVKE